MLDLERYGKMLEKVKMLEPLQNDDSKELYDNLIEFSLSKVIQDVSNYTNIPVDDLPFELDNTMVSMVQTMIDSHELLSGLDDNKVNGIQSLSEGDTSITFRSKSDIYTALQNVNPITDNYVNILNNFRVVKW